VILSESQKANLEKKAIPVESMLGNDTMLCIQKEFKGMWILQKGKQYR